MIDHRNFGAANIAKLVFGHQVQVAAFKFNGATDNAAVDPEVLHDAQGNRGFAAPRFANQPHRLTGLDCAAKIHHGWNFVEAGEKRN